MDFQDDIKGTYFFMSKHICFLLDYYPTQHKHTCIFVKYLIHEISNYGIKCTVIAPQAITPQCLKTRESYHRVEKTNRGESIDVYMPYYPYFKAGKRTIKLSMKSHFNTVMRVMQKNNICPDIMYGHFIFQGGLTAARVGEKLGIPSYLACGENSTRLLKDSNPYKTGLDVAEWAGILNKLSGIISVSEYNKELLIENGFVDKNMKFVVLPNGVNTDVFHPIDQKEARKRLGLPDNKFIVLFNGSFIERKGFGKLCEALDQIEDVSSVFVGSDSVRPSCHNVLFSGRVDPEEIPYYVNASDVLVLPTLGEGCCNAIVEALMCNKPVISSDRPFNHGLLDEHNSILVDPENVIEIMEAIYNLKTGKVKLTDQINNNNYDIRIRAKKILSFMGINKC